MRIRMCIQVVGKSSKKKKESKERKERKKKEKKGTIPFLSGENMTERNN